MTYTYTTKNPHGRVRDLLIDEMLDKLAREEEEKEKEKEG